MSFPSLSSRPHAYAPSTSRSNVLPKASSTATLSQSQHRVTPSRTTVTTATKLQRAADKQNLLFRGVMPGALLDKVQRRFGDKTLIALLQTPMMQKHLQTNQRLDETQLAQFKAAAQRIGDLGDRSLQALQFHADSLLGRTVDLSDHRQSIEAASRLVAGSINKMRQTIDAQLAACAAQRDLALPFVATLRKLAAAERQCADTLGPLVDEATAIRGKIQDLQQTLAATKADDPKHGVLTRALERLDQVLQRNQAKQAPIRFHMGAIRQERAEQERALAPIKQKYGEMQQALTDTRQALEPQIDRQRQALTDFRQATVAMRGATTAKPADLERLHEYFGDLAAALDGEPQSALDDMRVYVKRGLYQAVADDFKRQLTEQLAAFRKSGAGKTFSTEISLGVGAALFGVEVASAKVGVKLEFSVTTTDTTQIWEGKSGKLSLGLKLGNDKIATVQADGAGQLAGGKVFNSLEDFVSYHADDLLVTLLAASPKHLGQSVENLSGGRQVRRYEGLVARNVRMLSPLQQRLIRQGVLGKGDRLVTEPLGKPVPGSYTNKNVSLEVGANVNLLPVGLGLTLNGTHTRLDIDSRNTLFSALKDDPSRIDQQKAKYFSVNLGGKTFDGKAGKAALDNLLKQAQQLRETQPMLRETRAELAELREQVQYALGALSLERQSYTELVNKYDLGGPHKKGMRAVKHSMEKARGANGRVEMEKAFTVTFAALNRVYQATFAEGDRAEVVEPFFHEQLRDMAAGFADPGMVVDLNKARKQLTTKNETHLSINSLGGTFTAKIPDLTGVVGLPKTGASGEVSVGVTATAMVNQEKPDEPINRLDLNIKVQAGMDYRSVLSAIMQEAPTQLAFDFSKPALGFSEMSLSDWNFSLKTAANLQIRFEEVEREVDGVKHKELVLLYARLTKIDTLGGNTPDVGIPTGAVGNAKLGFGAEYKDTHQVFEHVGTKSLGYISGKFNTWRKAGIEKAQWPAFAQDHKSEFRHLFHNFCDANGQARFELEKGLDEIADDGLRTRTLRAFSDFHHTPNNINFALALEAFTHYLDRKAAL